jgi:hypothetical protein
MREQVPPKLLAFARALGEADALYDEWWYFITRPEKWAREYAIWANLGCPGSGDGALWTRFCEQVHAAPVGDS